MENVIQTTPQIAVPLLYKAAAVSVIAAALTGVGVMTGVVPVKGSTPQSVAAQGFSAPVALQPAPTNVLAAPALATPVPVPTVVYLPAPEPVAKPKVAKAVQRPLNEPTITASRVSTHPAEVSSSGDSRMPNERNYPNERSYPNDRGYGNNGAGQSYPVSQGPAYPPVVAQAPARALCYSCGTVESIREIEKPGDGSGLGAVGGAVGGAVLGRQFGNGRGKDLLSVLGAVGGGYAGHQIEKNVRTVKSYEVQVRMEDGSLRTVSSASQPNWRAGDRVKVDGGSISMQS